MVHESYAFKQAQTAADAARQKKAADEQHERDRMAKKTQAYGAKGKQGTLPEHVNPTEKEMKAWRAEVAEKLAIVPGKETEKRRRFENDEKDSRSSYYSWRRSTIEHQKKKEAAKKGRGIVSHSAVRRLMRELKMVNNDPSWGVAAQPVDDNILYWHCNVAAPGGMRGKGVLHLELKFPPEYPAVPPKVKILGADVTHPNIYGDWICVDMLERGEFEVDNLVPYTGWSSAYGVQAMLRQLQSFFYSGADGDAKAHIRIKPWRGTETWEYQLAWDEVKTWRDWDYDEHSFCCHRHAKPGDCPYSWCTSKGLHTRKWFEMHPADGGRLEVAYQRAQAEDAEPGADTVVLDDLVFTRKLPARKVKKAFVMVNYATGIKPNRGLHHEAVQSRVEGYWSWKPYVEVHCGNSVTRTGGAVLHEKTEYRNDEQHVPKTAGPKTAVWRQEVEVTYAHALDVSFKIFDGADAKTRRLIGTASLGSVKEMEGVQTFDMTLKPDLNSRTADKTLRNAGGLGHLNISVRMPSKKERLYEFSLTPQGIDGDFVQRNLYSYASRTIRRRAGYRCETCDHTPLEPKPELPSVIECDDAPTFALRAFYEAAQEAAGDNPEAIAAVERTMAALEEEQAAKKRVCDGPSNFFFLPNDAVELIFDFLPRMRERRHVAQMWPSWMPVYHKAKYWEAQHLRCFTTGANPTEDVLGVGVLAAEAPNGRPIFTCQFDAVSQTAYKEGVRLGVWKEPFTHWVPLFIDQFHAKRAMPHFLPQLDKLAVGVRSTNSAWTACGADLDGKGKERLRKVKDAEGHVFRSTSWAGLRGGSFCASGAQYFQVQIVDYKKVDGMMVGGKSAARGVVKVGWVTQTGDANLGTDKYGFAYSTAGHKVHDAERDSYGPTMEPGDVIGTLWNAADRTISYFWNGKALGTAFTVPDTGDYPGLIPCVAMNCATVEVDIAGGYDAPIPVDKSTLGAHERSVERSVGTCLAVLPQLMNHMVTEVMKGKLHASVKALQGYCSLHRLLLHCCEAIPNLTETLDRCIERFIQYPQERHKVICPDLGMLLCMLTVSQRYSWSDLKNPFMSELFTRHVRWSIKKSRYFQAGLLIPDKARDDHMVDEAFYANETSCKLVMFQVFFCNLVKPDAEYVAAHQADAFRDTKLKYDGRMGFPTADMVQALVDEIDLVSRLPFKKWNGFFANVGAEQRTTKELAGRICKAIAASEKAGYHSDCTFMSTDDAVKQLRKTPFPKLPFQQRPVQKRRFFKNEYPEVDERDDWNDHGEDYHCDY